MSVCNKCNSIDVVHASEVELNTYKGTEYSINIDYSTCNSCYREFLTKPQIIANEAKVREARKEIDGLLSAEALKAIRKSLNLSQADASIVFGGGQNAFSKYERSEVTQSQAMDKLLRLASSDRYIYRKLLGHSSLAIKSHFISSVEISNLSAHNVENWTNSQFSIPSATHEISKPRLKLVA